MEEAKGVYVREKEDMRDTLTELVIPEIEVQIDPEVIPKIVISQEEIKLGRSRVLMKTNYPKLKFIETLEAINQFRDNPRCNTCKSYYKQSSIPEIKAKLRRDKGTSLTFFKLRLYKNSAEKLDASKGYCCSTITISGEGLITSGVRQAKTIIHVPHMSLCSNYMLHPDIHVYFRLLTLKLKKEEKLKREAIELKKSDLLKKEKAQKLIISIDKKYKVEK